MLDMTQIHSNTLFVVSGLALYGTGLMAAWDRPKLVALRRTAARYFRAPKHAPRRVRKVVAVLVQPMDRHRWDGTSPRNEKYLTRKIGTPTHRAATRFHSWNTAIGI